MQYFKKFPIFFSIITLLLLAFVAGVAYDVMLSVDVAKTEKKLKNARADFDDALAKDPTDKAINAADKNIKALAEHLEFLEKDLTRARNDIFSTPPSESYQLVEQLRGRVQKWKRAAKQRDIVVANDMDFGFKRYVAPNAEPPADEAAAPIWKQACVLDYINGKLFASKTEQSPMAIVNVQREVLAQESGKQVAQRKQTAFERRRRAARMALRSNDKSDTFTIDPNITARKQGSLDTLAYKIEFAAHTDVLRRFLNQLKDFDAMLVVRSIDVVPASADITAMVKRGNVDEETAGLEEIFGANNGDSEQKEGDENSNPEQTEAQAAEMEKIKTPVVTDNLSKFSVVIEYVEVVNEPESKKPSKQED